jgi:uncharacterized membrane protein YdbT with pleckstrin-like domain
MGISTEETQEGVHYEEENWQELATGQNAEQEENTTAEEKSRQEEQKQDLRLDNETRGRSSFAHGLSVGLGIGCIATFAMIWVSVFFTPRLPSITYVSMLATFIYPLVYLLAVGLITLTAGIVKEFHV